MMRNIPLVSSGLKTVIFEPFVLKRRLNYGSTFEAETFTDPKLSAIANRTAQLINIV